MDNKADKPQEKKEKKGLKLNKQKLAEFFKRNGFYIALFICIAAAGLTAILTLTGTEPPQPQDTEPVPDEQQVEKQHDATLEEELARYAATPSPTATPLPSPSVTPSPSPTATGKTDKSSKPSFYLEAPLKGKIIKAFMIDKLTYNKTLNQWATHNGIDIQAQEGDTIRTALGGTVEAAYNDQVYGGVVIVKHDNNRKTVYAGILPGEKVKEGAKVDTGQTLGTVKTPNFEAYLGPHLHFELMEGENYLDPVKYFK